MSNLILETGKKIRIGMVGFSAGNGHPYSWSAICNGYNPEKMSMNEFPVILDYLERRSWPQDQLPGVCVNAIYCDDVERSQNIADASFIEHVCCNISDLIGCSDVIFLARDDVYSRRILLEYLIESGKPIYVDKPFAVSEEEALELFAKQKYPTQLFTTSALRYARELYLTDQERQELGELVSIFASTPKTWVKYAAHIIEPIVAQIPYQYVHRKLNLHLKGGGAHLVCDYGGVNLFLSALGSCHRGISIEYQGMNKTIVKYFNDSFGCFKSSINAALTQWRSGCLSIEREQTLAICKMLNFGVVS